MSSLPIEIFYNITNFLPNDDITDMMLLSRNFNALVTPRLKKIDEEMAIMNQSIKSFMPSPEPDPSDCEWISQLNLKKFEPIGSKAKQAMKEVFVHDDDFRYLLDGSLALDAYISTRFGRFKQKMSLERFNDPTFLRILGALVATPKFREEYNVPSNVAHYFVYSLNFLYENYFDSFDDVERIWSFYGENGIFD